jgi:hypothetical protein
LLFFGEYPGQQCFLGVQPVFRLVENHGAGTIQQANGYLFPVVGR